MACFLSLLEAWSSLSVSPSLRLSGSLPPSSIPSFFCFLFILLSLYFFFFTFFSFLRRWIRTRRIGEAGENGG